MGRRKAATNLCKHVTGESKATCIEPIPMWHVQSDPVKPAYTWSEKARARVNI